MHKWSIAWLFLKSWKLWGPNTCRVMPYAFHNRISCRKISKRTCANLEWTWVDKGSRDGIRPTDMRSKYPFLLHSLKQYIPMTPICLSLMHVCRCCRMHQWPSAHATGQRPFCRYNARLTRNYRTCNRSKTILHAQC